MTSNTDDGEEGRGEVMVDVSDDNNNNVDPESEIAQGPQQGHVENAADNRISNANAQLAGSIDRDGALLEDSVVGHGGHLIAAMYNEQRVNEHQDSKALIRMGIFAGIALAFHVSVENFSFLPSSPLSLSLSLIHI